MWCLQGIGECCVSCCVWSKSADSLEFLGNNWFSSYWYAAHFSTRLNCVHFHKAASTQKACLLLLRKMGGHSSLFEGDFAWNSGISATCKISERCCTNSKQITWKFWVSPPYKKKKGLNRNPMWEYERDYSEQALWSKTNSLWKAENQCYL